MTLDSRWKLPQGKTPEALYDCIFSLVRELRKSDYLPTGFDADAITYDNAASGLAATDAQAAIDEVEGRVDDLEAGGTLVAETAQSTATGTAFDFTGIPSWVKRISVLFDQVSLDGTDEILVQIGDSGGIENTGYISGAGIIVGGAVSQLADSAGFNIMPNNAGRFVSGIMTIAKLTGNVWVASHACGDDVPIALVGGGSKELSGTLDRVRITRSGTDNFDNGQVNILYE
jgi:hypothetical protein